MNWVLSYGCGLLYPLAAALHNDSRSQKSRPQARNSPEAATKIFQNSFVLRLGPQLGLLCIVIFKSAEMAQPFPTQPAQVIDDTRAPGATSLRSPISYTTRLRLNCQRYYDFLNNSNKASIPGMQFSELSIVSSVQLHKFYFEFQLREDSSCLIYLLV